MYTKFTRKRWSRRIAQLPEATHAPIMLAMIRSLWINEGKAWAA